MTCRELNQEVQAKIVERQELKDEVWQPMNKYNECGGGAGTDRASPRS